MLFDDAFQNQLNIQVTDKQMLKLGFGPRQSI
jgi:hypothetical protein